MPWTTGVQQGGGPCAGDIGQVLRDQCDIESPPQPIQHILRQATVRWGARALVIHGSGNGGAAGSGNRKSARWPQSSGDMLLGPGHTCMGGVGSRTRATLRHGGGPTHHTVRGGDRRVVRGPTNYHLFRHGNGWRTGTAVGPPVGHVKADSDTATPTSTPAPAPGAVNDRRVLLGMSHGDQMKKMLVNWLREGRVALAVARTRCSCRARRETQRSMNPALDLDTNRDGGGGGGMADDGSGGGLSTEVALLEQSHPYRAGSVGRSTWER